MPTSNTDGAIGASTTVKVSLDQVVRLVVVLVVFCLGWLYRAQEAIRVEQRAIWDRLEANAIERQVIATKVEVMDKVGQKDLSNLGEKFDRVEREFRELKEEARKGAK